MMQFYFSGVLWYFKLYHLICSTSVDWLDNNNNNDDDDHGNGNNDDDDENEDNDNVNDNEHLRVHIKKSSVQC